MARPASLGSAFTDPRTGKHFLAVSIGKGDRMSRLVPSATTKDEARERARIAAELVNALRAAKQETFIEGTVEGVAQATETELAEIRDVVRRIVAGTWPGAAASLPTKAAPGGPTFGDVARMLTSGELQRKYPDAIEPVTADYDKDRASTLDKYVLPTLGPVPIAALTIDHGHDVMAKVPVTLSKSRRKQVLQHMKFVAGLAAWPLRLIPANPLAPMKVRAGKEPRVRGFLYPDEDAALLGCVDNPLVYRLAFGFQTREGMRREEMATLEWRDVDLRHGVVRLDENKTDDPREWPMDRGVTAALAVWKEMQARAFPAAVAKYRELVESLQGRALERMPAPPDAPRFVFGAHGGAFPLPLDSSPRLEEILRESLKRAGVDRPELHEGTAKRMRIGTHDLRATFVTIASAQGKNERWISRRTGHKSHSMIATYQRAADGLAEGDAVRLAPLVDAIPELSKGTAGEPSAPTRNGDKPPPAETENAAVLRREVAENCESHSGGRAFDPRQLHRQNKGDRDESPRVNDSTDTSDPSKCLRSRLARAAQALSAEVPGAIEEGDLVTVRRLRAALDALLDGADGAPAGVVDLDAARARR